MPLRSKQRLRSPTVLVWVLVIFAWSAVWAVAAPPDAEKKSDTLRAAMRRIDDMRMAISLKRTRAEQIRDFVRTRQVDLTGEMRQRLDVLSIDAFDQALKDDRIRFNLRLFGQLRAYGDILAERITFFERGDHRLAFYYAQADDDLKMIQTLSDLAVGELIADITKAVASYRQAVDAPLMDVDRISIPSMGQVWPQISPSPSQ